MAILDVLKKKKAPAKKPAVKKTSVKKEETTKSETSQATAGNRLSNTLLRSPHVSEKAARLADSGTYVFRVALNAEKVSIKKAVEALYGVKVEKVRIIAVAGKPVRRGKRVSFRQDIKKALVTLKKGQTIAMYEGV